MVHFIFISRSRMSGHGFSVVIPVFNELDNIEPLLLEITQACQDLPYYEIVVVDDCSNDGTYEKLKSLKAKMSQIQLLRHVRNAGQSISVIDGVRAAKFSWIITLDGDGQNDPADIPRLIQELQNHGFDEKVLVAGFRNKRQDNWLRLLSTKVANRIRSNLLKDDCPDSGCGLKLFAQVTFLQLPLFNHVHRFLPALFKRAGGQVLNVKVNHRPRLRGVSKYGVMNRLWVGIVDLFGVAWLMRRPIKSEIEIYD